MIKTFYGLFMLLNSVAWCFTGQYVCSVMFTIGAMFMLAWDDDKS